MPGITSAKALTAFIIGSFASAFTGLALAVGSWSEDHALFWIFFLLALATGFMAVVIGSVARRDIQSSKGRLQGALLATLAIMLGLMPILELCYLPKLFFRLYGTSTPG